ncbi:MAG: nucleoside hydrolase [Myxococcota bacterium]|nr:nucleoside hydrolase [Myxococcota bacterium]
MRIWLDTDIGSDVDDALTLAYLLRHPGFELAGLSTVFGDVELRSEIALALLEIGGAPNLPVITGLGAPLSPGRQGLMFGHEGQGILESPAPRLRTDSEPDRNERIERLADAVGKAEADVIVAIGPLSNLAALIEAGLSLPPLAIMGGKLSDVMVRGMIEGVPEWNWFTDPLAAQIVIGAQHTTLPRVVPAEVTFRTALADGDVERMAEGDPLTRQLAVLCRRWLEFLGPHTGNEEPKVVLHDPLTAAILVEESLCPFEAKRIEIDDRAASTLVDGAPNVSAAIDVDAPALRDHLMQTWLPEG